MHRTDADGNVDGQHSQGGPGQPATVISADILNALQEEVCAVIESTDAELDKNNNAQLLTAINSLIATAIQGVEAAWLTGDTKLTLRSTAPAGWVLADDGTIGAPGSGATTREHEDCEQLYTLIWTSVADVHAPVTGGRGANAGEDWIAGKPISLTRMLGRALAVAGGGSGLSPRELGEVVGGEQVTLSVDQLPAHAHEIDDHEHSLSDHSHSLQDHNHDGVVVGTSTVDVEAEAGNPVQVYNVTGNSGDAGGGSTGDAGVGDTSEAGGGDTADTGGGLPVDILGPRAHLNVMIKL